jgi:hypothetical protein
MWLEGRGWISRNGKVGGGFSLTRLGRRELIRFREGLTMTSSSRECDPERDRLPDGGGLTDFISLVWSGIVCCRTR